MRADIIFRSQNVLSRWPSCRSRGHVCDVVVSIHFSPVHYIIYILVVSVFVPSAADGVYGPVLVWRENQWMPVCETGWTDKQAQVICKQLNYTTGYGFCCSTFSTWLQSIVTYSKALTIGTCPASANKIEDCQSVVLTNACGYRHQASVLCLNQTKNTDGECPVAESWLVY
jgi:hypothetical protein